MIFVVSLCCGQVCGRMMPGYGEQMRAISLKCVSLTKLSNSHLEFPVQGLLVRVSLHIILKLPVQSRSILINEEEKIS